MTPEGTRMIRPQRRFSLERDAWGRLVLAWPDGQRQAGLRAVRAFPLSAPREAIALCDAEGREIVWVARLDDLADETRGTIQDELSRVEFLPVIERIVERPTHGQPAQWAVHTDRGRTQFAVRGEDDVRRLGDWRALIVDAQGVRYLINDLRGLDSASRRSLERYLC